ncbi:hypothetical protein VOLCADRAFT_100027 [Volvox carteri f. nagariensis]|uniref:Uncharacterized protein n=1 Tax=Volvox carteri f. nagariensis TaxID=3068 RepID=D8UJ84_VOLCA|nr:uncharacterized protein VOLCADRAFT_100027 [Volvox carteri f. nagariensis]EFJ40240.1 hypothetical protein VOLCADRAFT_100027 [Volvox carteri f. nagariensis]|eukprot:XP_002958720.1 hypothetical protein VOLCADRAFT_100027 [Volvox carteri f. nagariensis]
MSHSGDAVELFYSQQQQQPFIRSEHENGDEKEMDVSQLQVAADAHQQQQQSAAFSHGDLAPLGPPAASNQEYVIVSPLETGPLPHPGPGFLVGPAAGFERPMGHSPPDMATAQERSANMVTGQGALEEQQQQHRTAAATMPYGSYDAAITVSPNAYRMIPTPCNGFQPAAETAAPPPPPPPLLSPPPLPPPPAQSILQTVLDLSPFSNAALPYGMIPPLQGNADSGCLPLTEPLNGSVGVVSACPMEPYLAVAAAPPPPPSAFSPAAAADVHVPAHLSWSASPIEAAQPTPAQLELREGQPLPLPLSLPPADMRFEPAEGDMYGDMYGNASGNVSAGDVAAIQMDPFGSFLTVQQHMQLLASLAHENANLHHLQPLQQPPQPPRPQLPATALSPPTLPEEPRLSLELLGSSLPTNNGIDRPSKAAHNADGYSKLTCIAAGPPLAVVTGTAASGGGLPERSISFSGFWGPQLGPREAPPPPPASAPPLLLSAAAHLDGMPLHLLQPTAALAEHPPGATAVSGNGGGVEVPTLQPVYGTATEAVTPRLIASHASSFALFSPPRYAVQPALPPQPSAPLPQLIFPGQSRTEQDYMAPPPPPPHQHIFVPVDCTETQPPPQPPQPRHVQPQDALQQRLLAKFGPGLQYDTLGVAVPDVTPPEVTATAAETNEVPVVAAAAALEGPLSTSPGTVAMELDFGAAAVEKVTCGGGVDCIKEGDGGGDGVTSAFLLSNGCRTDVVDGGHGLSPSGALTWQVMNDGGDINGHDERLHGVLHSLDSSPRFGVGGGTATGTGTDDADSGAAAAAGGNCKPYNNNINNNNNNNNNGGGGNGGGMSTPTPAALDCGSSRMLDKVGPSGASSGGGGEGIAERQGSSTAAAQRWLEDVGVPAEAGTLRSTAAGLHSADVPCEGLRSGGNEGAAVPAATATAEGEEGLERGIADEDVLDDGVRQSTEAEASEHRDTDSLMMPNAATVEAAEAEDKSRVLTSGTGAAPQAWDERQSRRRRLLQVRRSTYHEVVQVADVAPLLDLQGVQLYTINHARVVFLRSRPQARPPKGAAMPSRCELDGRQLMDVGARYCSLRCKIEMESDNIMLDRDSPAAAAVRTHVEAMQAGDGGAAAGPAVQPVDTSLRSSSALGRSMGAHPRRTTMTLTKDPTTPTLASASDVGPDGGAAGEALAAIQEPGEESRGKRRRMESPYDFLGGVRGSVSSGSPSGRGGHRGAMPVINLAKYRTAGPSSVVRRTEQRQRQAQSQPLQGSLPLPLSGALGGYGSDGVDGPRRGRGTVQEPDAGGGGEYNANGAAGLLLLGKAVASSPRRGAQPRQSCLAQRPAAAQATPPSVATGLPAVPSPSTLGGISLLAGPPSPSLDLRRPTAAAAAAGPPPPQQPQSPRGPGTASTGIIAVAAALAAGSPGRGQRSSGSAGSLGVGGGGGGGASAVTAGGGAFNLPPLPGLEPDPLSGWAALLRLQLPLVPSPQRPPPPLPLPYCDPAAVAEATTAAAAAPPAGAPPARSPGQRRSGSRGPASSRSPASGGGGGAGAGAVPAATATAAATSAVAVAAAAVAASRGHTRSSSAHSLDSGDTRSTSSHRHLQQQHFLQQQTQYHHHKRKGGKPHRSALE